jgi:hypothetical protein
MSLVQDPCASVHVDNNPTLEVPPLWSPLLMEGRAPSVDEGAYRYVPRKLTATQGLDVDQTNSTPSVEMASAPKLFPRHSTPGEAMDVAAVRLVEVAKATVTVIVRGQSIKLRRQDVLALLDLLESTL